MRWSCSNVLADIYLYMNKDKQCLYKDIICYRYVGDLLLVQRNGCRC